YDHPLAVPRAAASVQGIAQVLDRAATDRDFLQLSLGEEADVPAIGRPKRILALFRSRQRLGIGSIERTEPEALRSIYSGGEDQIAPVGRKGEAVDLSLCRERDDCTQDTLGRRRLTEVQPAEA